MTEKYLASAGYFSVRFLFVIYFRCRIIGTDGVIGNIPGLSSWSYGFESRSVHPIEFPRENASALCAVMGSSARKEKGVLKSTESALARKWRFEPMVFKKVFISSNFFEEAGGKVTDLNGNERRYDEDGIGCLVSNGILHDELLKIIQTCKL